MTRKINFLLSILMLGAMTVSAQGPKFYKNTIGKLGTTISFPIENMTFDPTVQDGKTVYAGSAEGGAYEYSVYHYEYDGKIGDNMEENVAFLKEYINFLQGQYGAQSDAGFADNEPSPGDANAKGVYNYWFKNNGTPEAEYYYVKGWLNTKQMTIFIVKKRLFDFDSDILEAFTANISFGK